MLTGLDNPVHLLLVLTVVMLLFGARRLPEAERSLGAGLRGFREELTGVRDSTSPARPVADRKVEG